MTRQSATQVKISSADDEPTPAQVVDALPANARNTVGKMKKVADQLRKDALQRCYALGKLAIQLRSQIGRRHQYGNQTMEMLADYIGVNLRLLYLYQRIAAKIPEEDFRQLIRPHVCIGHVQILLDYCVVPGLRANLSDWAQRISDEHLTVEQLRSAMLTSGTASAARANASSTNEKSKRPKSLRPALVRFDKLVTVFAGKSRETYFGDDFNLVDVVQQTAPDQFTDEIRTLIARSADGLAAIARDAAENSRDMRDTLAFVDGCIRRTRIQEALENNSDNTSKTSRRLTGPK